MLLSITIALLFTLLNTLVSFWIAIKAMKSDPEKFNSRVMLSMTVRYGIATVFVWFSLVILKLDPLYFGLTFIISTFIFIFIEILYLNFRSNFLILKNSKE